VQTLFAALLPVVGLHREGGIGAVILEIVLRSLPAVILVSVQRRIIGQIAAAEAALHAVHFAHIHTQFICHRPGLVGT